MAEYDFAAPRLFVDFPLREGETVSLPREASHYLLSVLRLGDGRDVLVFNGRDGEWRASIGQTGRRDAELRPVVRIRQQPNASGPALLFAPLKHARLDYMVQKAVELGASTLRPVLTRRTIVSRVNLDRMRANAIEAAEQCGILSVPTIHEPVPLRDALATLQGEGTLVFCDEDAPGGDPVAGLRERRAEPVAVLIGPEGGFDPEERTAILAHPGVCRLSLGPRVLRADTAAVAALTLVQAVLGDWR